MGFWPFGGGKKKSTNKQEPEARETLLEKETSETMSRRPPSKPQSAKTSRPEIGQTKSARLTKPRTLGEKNMAINATPRSFPTQTSTTERRASTSRSNHDQGMYRQNTMSQSSIGPENFTVLPTLRARRNDYDPSLPRRKSSKRKAEDYAREREVKAMSAPIPIPKRNATYSGSGPLMRDTKQIPGDLNRRLHRPTSEIALPQKDSLLQDEDLTSQGSFKIGMLAVLSPRPTLKYDANPRSAAGKQPARLHAPLERPIAEEEENELSRKRIDDLADDLDSGGLRELMERDRRRREKKKEMEKAKLQRKLQRRAERQREEETKIARAREYVESIQSGQDEHPTSHDDSSRADQSIPTAQSSHGPDLLPDDIARTLSSQQIRNPFDDEEEIEEADVDPVLEGEDHIPVPMKSPMRTLSPVEAKPMNQTPHGTLSPPTSPIQGSVENAKVSQDQYPKDSAQVGEDETETSVPSTSPPAGQVSTWTSFFKRGSRRTVNSMERGRATPSEFSNTSRESFARKQPPPLVTPRTFRRSDSAAVPQRTMSKFREDLPELPISPPDSRVQSPEVASTKMTSPVFEPSPRNVRQSLSGTMDVGSLATESSHLTQDRSRTDSHLQARKSMDVETTGTSVTGAAGLSQSLASVDSEGSWLSGKPVKRLSSPMGQSAPPPESPIPMQMPGAFEPESEDLANDEYLNRLTPAAEDRRESTTSGRKASSTVIDLRREQEDTSPPEVPSLPQKEDEKWHQGLARQATVVRQAPRAKSKEGLLKQYQEGTIESSSSEDEAETPGDDTGNTPLEYPILRARSVDYKGHARQISAGSARLLDIRRSSVQSESNPKSPRLSRGPDTLPQHEPIGSTNESA